MSPDRIRLLVEAGTRAEARVAAKEWQLKLAPLGIPFETVVQGSPDRVASRATLFVNDLRYTTEENIVWAMKKLWREERNRLETMAQELTRNGFAVTYPDDW